MSRQEANRRILQILAEAVERYPDFRFGQIAYSLGIFTLDSNDFYAESVTILEDVQEDIRYRGGI